MSHQRILRVMFAAVIVFFLVGTVRARADIYMKQKTHTDAFKIMGQTQPEKDDVKVYWLSANKARVDMDNGISMLFFSDKKVLYALNHNQKTYSEISMDFDKMIDQQMEGEDKKAKAEAKKAAQMMKGIAQGMMGQMSVKVTETGITKTIKNWNCRKYLIDMNMAMGKSKAEAWATQDIKINHDLYFMMANAMMAQMPGFDKLVREMRKVKGLIVYQTSKAMMMGAEVPSTTEVLLYEEKKAPGGTFQLPVGYKKVKAVRD